MNAYDALRILQDPVQTALMVEALRSEHRTNQQQMLRGALALVEAGACAYDDGAYDLRNEQSTKACADAMAGVDLPQRFAYV